MAKDIGIDLGTANVLINVKGKGIVLNEPSVVAVDTQTGKVLAVGSEAYKMVGRTPSNIRAIRPMKDGVIADFDMTEQMLSYFIKKLNVKGFMSKPNILICAPTNTTDIERKAIRQAAEKSGGGNVYLEEEPKVAAIGAGLDILSLAETWLSILVAARATSPFFPWATSWFQARSEVPVIDLTRILRHTLRKIRLADWRTHC